MEYSFVIDAIGGIIDLLGVLAIVWGIFYALLEFGLRYFHTGTMEQSYDRLRQNLGRTIIIGLEILIAGDIIRSIAVPPSFTNVGVLAIVVVIRAFLSSQIESGTQWHLPLRMHRVKELNLD